MSRRFEISSTLPVETEVLWEHCSSMAGVSLELQPWIRMSYPPGAESLVHDQLVPGERLFRSRLSAFGVIPVDYSDLTLVEIEPGRRFLERSPMLTQRLWEHERTLEPVSGGTQITDRLEWEGKARPLTALYSMVVPLLFRWRHRRLRQLFGG